MQMFFCLFERGFVPCLCIDKMLCCVLFSMLSVCQILINTNFLFAISLFCWLYKCCICGYSDGKLEDG